MKKTIIIILVFLISGTGSYFAFKYLANKSNQNRNIKNLANYNKPFMWGVVMRASALGNYQPQIWLKQIKMAKQLGVGWVRISWDYENVDPFKRNDEVLGYLMDNGIQPILIIEEDSRKDNNYQSGFEYGYEIASHYKGKIHFYQVINEGGVRTVNSQISNGQDISQYKYEEYKKQSDLVRGISEGIAKADPSAWRIINIVFTHTGYLDLLVKDNVPFDMIGIDWYGWMGSFSEKKMDNGQMLSDKLKSYNKPLVFMEVNSGSTGIGDSRTHHIVNEQEQSDFIAQTAEWAWENRDYVKGFFVHELVDNVNNPHEDSEYFGIVQAEKSSGGSMVPGDPRKSFYTYQELIKKYLGQ